MLVCMFKNGATDIDALYTAANPFADCKGSWAESYVAYCYKTGIIGGVGGNLYAPSAKVTGIQYLKMVLIVLGYNAKSEGLEGPSWAVNTLALAKRACLLDGLGDSFDVSANLLRGQAAQIMQTSNARFSRSWLSALTRSSCGVAIRSTFRSGGTVSASGTRWLPTMQQPYSLPRAVSMMTWPPAGIVSPSGSKK